MALLVEYVKYQVLKLIVIYVRSTPVEQQDISANL